MSTNPTIEIDAFCHDCKKRHRVNTSPAGFAGAMSDWEKKHRGHNFEFLSPYRTLPRGIDDRYYLDRNQAPWWLDYKHNADVKLALAADADLTITIANLAESATRTFGRESTAVDNGTNLYLDYLLAGFVTVGTTPTANEIMRVYLYGSLDDTPTFPDVLDGTDSDETITSENVRDSMLPLYWETAVDSTSDRAYYVRVGGIASFFNGLVPDQWGVFFTQSTDVNMNTTGGNHRIVQTGVYATST